MRPAAVPFVIRPRQGVLAALLRAYGALVVLIVVGALRTGQGEYAWLGAAFALLFLPVVDFYRQRVTLGSDAVAWRSLFTTRQIRYADIAAWGMRQGWVYQSGMWRWLSIIGRDGTRIDVPTSVTPPDQVASLVETLRTRASHARETVPSPPHTRWSVGVAVSVGIAVIALAMLLSASALPATLDGRRLFHEAAAIGIVAGLALGIALARSLLDAMPVVAVVTVALAVMALAPAAALLGNTMARGPVRTTRMTVLDRQSFSDRDGKAFYRADVEIDGVRKRLWLSAQQWTRLGERTDFPACVSDGALGFVVVRSYTAECPAPSR